MLSWNVCKDGTITVVDDNFVTHTTTQSNPNWGKILEELRRDNGDEVVRLMSISDSVMDYFSASGKIAIKGGTIWYGNQVLHGLDVERTLDMMRINVPVGPMVSFLEAKMRNPSQRAVNELYKFLDHRQMPITPNGTILGYKGVQADFYSRMGNPKTVVLQGKTNEAGQILNEIGATIEVARNSVCDDYKEGCAEGLHIGSREYAESWAGPEGKVLLVEFSPEDAVSVPECSQFQKLRACKYTIHGECPRDTKLSDTYTSEYTTPQVEDEDDDSFESDIENVEMVEVEQPESDESGEEDYENGLEYGEKDGKAHRRRLFNRNDEDGDIRLSRSVEWITGYNDGYEEERRRQRRLQILNNSYRQ